MSDYSKVVRENHHRTTGFIVARTQPCITIRDDEIRNIRRRIVALHPGGLKDLDPGESWLMGVILCPGDDTKEIAAFASRIRRADRIRFYVHPETDIATVFAHWLEAGHKRARVDVVASWKELHPPFGRSLNDAVYADFGQG